MKWLEELKKLDPCGLDTPEDKTQAWGWCQQFKTLKQAWEKCERDDWMLWLWSKHPNQVTLEVHRKMVLCACEIARTVLKHVAKGEDRPRLAIEAAEKWAENPTEENRVAADAAYAAAYAAARAARAAADAAADAAAYAAAYAADAAGAAACAAAYAAYAADAAADAAAYAAAYAAYAAAYAADAAARAAAYAAYAAARKRLAMVVRKHLKPPKLGD